MTRDKSYRSFAKAVSWRLTGTIDTVIIAFLITGKVNMAFSIGGIELFTKITLYYVHERVWNKIPFGRVEIPPDKPSYEI